MGFRNTFINEFITTIPLTNLSIDKNGIINGSDLSFVENSKVWIIPSFWNNPNKVLLDKIILLSFKPIFVPFKYWNQIDVLYLDGNENNRVLSNLSWKFPIGLGEEENNGFAYIPGYSRYMLDRDGNCFDNKLNENKKVYVLDDYFCVKLKPDWSKLYLTSRIHRLLCITFKSLPLDIDNKQVNHIDTIKANNNLDNLEWCTSKENLLHARNNGLIKNMTVVFVKNILTQQIIKFDSMTKCAKAFNISRATLMERLSNKSQPVYSGHYLFSYSQEFKNVVSLKEELSLRNLPRPVKLLNIETGIVNDYETIKLASSINKIPLPGLYNALRFKKYKDFLNWVIVDKNDEFPTQFRDCIKTPFIFN